MRVVPRNNESSPSRKFVFSNRFPGRFCCHASREAAGGRFGWFVISQALIRTYTKNVYFVNNNNNIGNRITVYEV